MLHAEPNKVVLAGREKKFAIAILQEDISVNTSQRVEKLTGASSGAKSSNSEWRYLS